MKLRHTLIWILVMGILLGVSAWELKAIAPKPMFQSGEKITYVIKKIGLKAGTATIEFKGQTQLNGRPVALIVFTARGMNFFDEEKIFTDPVSFYPLIVQRDLNIWGKREQITEDYTQPGKVLIKKTAGGKTSEQTIEKSGTIDNIYTFIYRYRQSGQFSAGEKFQIHLPTLDVTMQLVKKTKIKINSEDRPVYYFKSDPEKFEVWFGIDDKKIPLQINGAVGFGDTVMVMRQYQG